MSQPTANHLFHLSDFSIDLSTIKQIQWDKPQQFRPFSSIDFSHLRPPKTFIYCQVPAATNLLEAVFVLDGSSESYKKDVETLKLGVGFTTPLPSFFAPIELLELLTQIPPTEERRLFDDKKPDGYMESDRDYIENNTEACVWFLQNANSLRNMGRELMRLHPERYQKPG